MKLTRREFIKSNAVAAAAASAGMSIPGVALAATPQSEEGVRWDKGVCRYCGTGCGVLVGVKDGRVVATQGDPDAPVNKGLNCVKGYFLSKIMYGKDRLTQPLLRMKDGKVRQERRVRADLLGCRLRHHGREGQGDAEGADPGRERRCHVRLRPMDGVGRLCRRQADEGRFPLQQHRPERAPLHGFRRRRLHAHLRHRRADGLLRRCRACRRVRPVGLEHGRDAPHPLVAHHQPPPDRQPRQDPRPVHLLAPFLRTGRQRADLQAAVGPGDPQLHLQLHHPEQGGQSGVRQEECRLLPGRHRHRLRPAAQPSAGTGGRQQRLPRRRRQAQGRPEQAHADHLRRLRQVRFRVHAGQGARDFRRAEGQAGSAGQGLCRSEGEGHLLLDHGLQPAHARHLGQ
jgi:hypothetical protein